MKIGFLGNANNYPFMLARAMRALGHEVTFIIVSGALLDRPENRYSEFRQRYPKWLHEILIPNPLDWVTPEFTKQRVQVLEILNECDAVILNQLGPSLDKEILKPSIVFLTGSDLLIYGDYKTANDQARQVVSRTPLRRLVRSNLTRLQFWKLVRRQRRGIKNAVGVAFFPRGISEQGDSLLDDIGVPDTRRMHLMLTEVSQLAPEPLLRHKNIRIFCGTRHNWVRPIPAGFCEVDYKGTDIFAKGLGLFFRRTGVNLDVRLVKKGMHVSETEELLAREGVADQVTWCDELDQEAFLRECRQADIIIDQLGQSTFGMVTLDGMALGRPVIANGRPEIFGHLFTKNFPVCQARTPEEVAAQLARLVLDSRELIRIGKQSRAFAEDHFSPERAARLCLDRFATVLNQQRDI